jgi:4-amino-4-deoxy-L-arabinose transferase-like glycosyltransferase
MTAARSIRLLVPVVILFVLVRLIYLRQLEGSPLLELLTLDAKYYHDWAARLAQGLGHPPGPFFLSPLYPILLSGLYAFFGGPNPTAAVAFQIVLSTGTLLLLFFAVRNLFDSTIAVVACLLAVFCAPWLYFDGMLLTSSLILFLNAGLLLLLAHALRSERPKTWLWLAAGVVAGLSALARPSVLLFVVLVLVWLALGKKEGLPVGRSRWLAGTMLVLGTLVALLPVLLRNISVSGSPLLTTSSAGINFYIGNRTGALGAYEELPWLEASDPQTEAKRYREEASRRTGQSLTLEQASRYWTQQALHDIVRHPAAWLTTLARKLWFTVQGGEIRTNLSFAAVRSFCPIVRLMPLTWGFLLPLAAAGLFLCWRSRRKMALLLFYLAAYLFVNLLFFSASEYRFPMILALLPLAARFLVGIFRELRERRLSRLVGALGIYLAVLIVVNFPSRLRAELTDPSLDFFNLGSEAVNRGQIERSIPLFTRALAAKPGFQQAHLELARSLWQVGNYDEARREFENARVAAPDTLHGAPLDNILREAWALYEEARYEEALAFLSDIFPAEATTPIEVMVLRAFILERLQRPEEAAYLFLRAASRDPANPEWVYRAALDLRSIGNLAACDSLLEVALAIHPAYAPAGLELGINALARGDTAAARVQLAELRRIRVPVDSIRIRIEELSRAIAGTLGRE